MPVKEERTFFNYSIMNDIVDEVDTMLCSKRKRHILGGVLLSVSAMLTGLAITIFTIKDEEVQDE